MRKVFLIITTIILLLLVFTVFFPYLYNYYIHPLSWLTKNINIGENYESVTDKLKKYEIKEKGTFTYSSGSCPPYVYKIHKSNLCVLANQESIFDDLELNIIFDENKKVKYKIYAGD